MWFSGSKNHAQLCDSCLSPSQSDDDSVLVRIKPIEYAHESIYYVPVFQKNFKQNGDPMFTPSFTYDLSMASTDEQMAASFDPDYILELRGTFKATTKPFKVGGDNENSGR